MRKRYFLVFALIVAGIALSLFMAITDSIESWLPDICAESCKAVHNSSFGSILGIPIGYFAAVFLAFVLWQHQKGRSRVVTRALGVVVGFEIYLTIIQFAHLELFCSWCLFFFGVIGLGYLFTLQKECLKTDLFIPIGIALAVHFVAFPPSVSLNPELIKKSDRPQIEIFASPSCEHCEDAIQDLENYCKTANVDLVLRPVGLSENDRKITIEWVCNSLFDKHNQATRRLSERVVYKNEAQARALNDGQLAVPIIIVKTGSEHKSFKGWTPEIKKNIESLFLASNEAYSSIIRSTNKESYFSKVTTEFISCGESIEPTCGAN